jgi:hypothetical protein
MRSCRPVQALAAPVRAVIGAGGSVLQWSFASAAAVPAKAFEADAGGAATDADAGGDNSADVEADAGVELDGGEVGADDAGEDSGTTPEESAAL